MCRAQEEGGRRCQGHLRVRIKERDEEETRLNERLSLLRTFKAFVTERMEAGDSFTAARKAFADKEGIPVTSLPRDIKKLDRDFDSVKNQLVQNEVRRNKDKGELAIIEERQEARAAARAALSEEERARRDRKAAAERARRAGMRADFPLRVAAEVTPEARERFKAEMEAYEALKSQSHMFNLEYDSRERVAERLANKAQNEYHEAAQIYLQENATPASVQMEQVRGELDWRLGTREYTHEEARRRNVEREEARSKPANLVRLHAARQAFSTAVKNFEEVTLPRRERVASIYGTH